MKAQTILLEKISQRDLKHLDPSERAELVNSFIFSALAITDSRQAIEHPLFWDLLCWATNILAIFAQASEDQTTLEIVRVLNKHFYSLHYSFPDREPELGPGREEHERIWAERIEGYL
jgi:hypothetical protein